MNDIENIKQIIYDNIFYDYDLDEILERDSVEFHAMTSEHTEILGQFMDCTAMNVEQLKECLISGYLSKFISF